jgi:hypothetical protein
MEIEVTLRVEESIYEQFMGSIGLYKHVTVVSTSTVRHAQRPQGRGGRHKRTGSPVVKAFDYQCRNKAARLMMLCKALKALGWIDGDTDCQWFIDLFSGGEFRQHIIWTGQANTLAELFRRLVNERGLLALPEKHSLWVTVNGHFWYKQKNQEFGTDRLRNTHIPYNQGQTIAYLVDMLDPEYTLDDIRMMIESQR